MNLASYLASINYYTPKEKTRTWSKESVAKRNATVRRIRDEKWKNAFRGEQCTSRTLGNRVNIADVCSVNQMMRKFIAEGLVRKCGENINERGKNEYIYEWIGQ